MAAAITGSIVDVRGPMGEPCGYSGRLRRRLRHDRSMDERLRQRAEGQGGVFTWQDVRGLLLRETELRSALRRGEVIRLRRDAYVLAEVWRAARPSERLALRTRAVLRARPGDVASHQSAVALHGLPCWGLPTDVVDLCGKVRRTRTAAGVRAHPRWDGLDPVDVDGVACVDIGTAVVQVAQRHGVVPALVALDRALHERTCRVQEVQGAVTLVARGRLERARLDQIIARADASCESVGETRTRLLLQDLGYEVQSQVTISDGDGVRVGRVDFLIGDLLVVEFDGMVKYEDADGREALAREKAREERLSALGCIVIRLVWADLAHPDRVRERVESALRRLARRS